MSDENKDGMDLNGEEYNRWKYGRQWQGLPLRGANLYDDDDDDEDEEYDEDEDDEDEGYEEDVVPPGMTQEEYDFKKEIAYLDGIMSNLKAHPDLAIDGYDDKDYYWLGDRNRLRERIYFRGWKSLKFREQIEMIVFNVMPKGDIEGVTQKIADHFGSMRRLMCARLEDFEGLDIPRVCKVWLMLTGRLVRRYLKYNRANFKPVFRYIDLMEFVSKIRDKHPWPQTCMLYADFEYRIMLCEKVSDSTHWMDPEITRRIIKTLVATQAKYAYMVLFCGPDPVEMDETEKEGLVSLAMTLKALRVELLDCLIVSDFGYFSIVRDGRFDILRREEDWRRTKKNMLYNFNKAKDEI